MMHGPGTVSWGPAGRLLGRMCSGMSGAIELGGADHLESRGRLGHMDLLTGVHSADCFFWEGCFVVLDFVERVLVLTKEKH